MRSKQTKIAFALSMFFVCFFAFILIKGSIRDKVVSQSKPQDSCTSKLIHLSQNSCFFGLSNVCLSNRTIRPHCTQLEEFERITLPDSRLDIDLAVTSIEKGQKLIWVPGHSMILDDFDNGFLLHLFHFVEHAIGHFILKRKYETKEDKMLRLEHIYLNLHSSLWNGQRSEWNELIMTRALDGFNKIHFSDSDFLNQEFCFEYLTISSRRACGENPVNSEINKALGDSWYRIAANHLRTFSKKMQGNQIQKQQKTYSSRKIVSYIKRKPPRTLESSLERSMIEMIEDMREFELRVLEMENMDPQTQLESIRDTDILIGVHGNGLTHIAFLVKDAFVIEIFPPNFSAFDYYLLSEMFGHRYFRFRDDKNGSLVFNGALYESFHGSPNSEVGSLNLKQLRNLLRSFV
ncbi:hypothetical protein GpartN1_g1779.t1 [Galdieria partita]|uniref:Glycosyltransferase 61 catalytic domain-containing protein n=1 Tax=Galdieria partita TaxID=83374 RepID=A0A9C7PSP7_9RHOD|nr:hypothetical protein GpartN1_g1779.t1 [Galdieria partita]